MANSIQRLMSTLIAGVCLFASVGVFPLTTSHGYASPRPGDDEQIDFSRVPVNGVNAAGKRTFSLNTAASRTVRLIHFVPNDRPFRATVEDSIKKAIKQVRSLFAGQMKTHGFGADALRFETDDSGELMIHRVTGQHADDHYADDSHSIVYSEIRQRFNTAGNVYIAFIDISGIFLPRGGRRGKIGGEASLGGDFAWKTVAHELGHAFGLEHDFRNGAYVMSYGAEQDSLSACAAEFLSVHPYFNPQISIEPTPGPSVELVLIPEFTADAETIPVQFRLMDPDGLHQLILFSTSTLSLASGFLEVNTCRGLANETDVVVEFDYERNVVASLINPSVEDIDVKAVDTDGNVGVASFNLLSTSPYHYATFEGHADWVVSLKFSPDGKILASASYDNTVRLWDPATRQSIARLNHSMKVYSLSFSPDGEILASASQDRTVRLWDVANHRHLTALEGHADGVHLVKFSPVGGILASASQDRTVRLWDVANRDHVATFVHENSVYSLAISPDGTLIATASGGNTVKLWNTAWRILSANLEGHKDKVTSVSFSPVGGILASASDDRTVKLWDTASRELLADLEAHKDKVSAVLYSPNGQTLASASVDNRVILWDAATGKIISILVGCSFLPASLAFSPDGSIFAAGGDQNDKVTIWDATTGESLASFHPKGDVISVSFSPDGRFLASGSDNNTVELWDMSTWVLPRAGTVTKISGDNQEGAVGDTLAKPLIVEVRDQYDRPLAGAQVTFTVIAGGGSLSSGFTTETATTGPDGRAQILLTLGPTPGKNTVEASISGLEVETFNAVGVGTTVLPGTDLNHPTWHLPGGATLRLGKGTIGPSDRSIAFSPDGRHFAVSSGIGVWLYTVEDLGQVTLLPSGIVHSLAYSSDGATLASGSGYPGNKEVRLWDVASGTNTATVTVETSGSIYLTLSPDGRTFAFPSGLGTIERLDVGTGRLTDAFAGDWSFGPSMSFSPDGTTIASGQESGSIMLWEVATRTNIATLDGHRREVLSVAFTPDGKALASASADGTVKLWDVETGTVSATIRGERFQAACVAFSPDGATLASGWTNRTVTLWDVEAERTTATFNRHRDWLRAVSFSPDGRTLASASEDGDVYLWDLATGNATAISGHTEAVWGMAVSRDGTTLASHSGTTKGKVNIWDAATGLKIVTLGGHDNVVRSISFAPDGATLASASSDRTVRLWDLDTHSTIGTLPHAFQLKAVSFSPDGNTLASGDFEGNVYLWDVKNQYKIKTLPGLEYNVTSLLFAPDGATVVAGTYGGEVRLWDVETGATVGDLEGHGFWVLSMSFSLEGATLATASQEHIRHGNLLHSLLRINHWNVADGIKTATVEGEWADDMAFSPDGTMFATGSQDKLVRIYDMSTGDIIATFEGHNHHVTSLLFMPDGTTLASGSHDGTILLWDLKRLHSRPHSLEVVSGIEQKGPAGTELPQALEVSVRDQNGEPYAGAIVTFGVTEGGGTLSATADTTDAGGKAATTLTLGILPGINTVVATVDDLLLVSFTAIGQANPDFDGDGSVGFADFLLFAANFGLSRDDAIFDARYDLDGNGVIGFSDFIIFANAFGSA